MRVCRAQRPDGTWEVWNADDPTDAIVGLGRFRSWLVYRLVKTDADA